MQYAIEIAAVCGFIIREAMSVLPAIEKDESSPSKFSFGYYFSRPRNIVLMVMNAAGAVSLMLAHTEVMTLLVQVPVIGPYFSGVAVPILTGALVGFAGAWIFRWLTTKMG